MEESIRQSGIDPPHKEGGVRFGQNKGKGAYGTSGSGDADEG